MNYLNIQKHILLKKILFINSFNKITLKADQNTKIYSIFGLGLEWKCMLKSRKKGKTKNEIKVTKSRPTESIPAKGPSLLQNP